MHVAGSCGHSLTGKKKSFINDSWVHGTCLLACCRGGERKKNPVLSKRKHLALPWPKVQYLLVLGHGMSDTQRLTTTGELHHYTDYGRFKIKTGSLHQHQRHFRYEPIHWAGGGGEHMGAGMGKLGLLPHRVPEHVQKLNEWGVLTANSPAKRQLNGLLRYIKMVWN